MLTKRFALPKTLILFFFISLVNTGYCSPPPSDLDSSFIVGSWKVDSTYQLIDGKYKPTKSPESKIESEEVWRFSEDKNYEIILNGRSMGDGTWWWENEILVCDYLDRSHWFRILEATENTLRLSLTHAKDESKFQVIIVLSKLE